MTRAILFHVQDPMTSRAQSGVSLIELLVTLSIAVILIAVAVPGFQEFFRRNRVESAASEFMATLNFARSEAIRRGEMVSVCKSRDGASCNTGSCNPAKTDPIDRQNCWERGWIVFTNPDNDDTVDTGEEVIRVHQALPERVTLNSDFTNRINYQPDGRITNTVGGSFYFCQGGTTEDARRIAVIGSGRARVETTNSCN